MVNTKTKTHKTHKKLNINGNSITKTKTKTNNKTKTKTHQKGGTDNVDYDLSDIFSRKQYLDKLDIKDKSLLWGLGVEHEMQIFHQGINTSKDNFEKANIIFDSQESTCFITSDTHEQGACCKVVPGYCYFHKNQIKNKAARDKLNTKQNKLTSNELKFLKALDWELTGRQAKGCKSSSTIIPRTPILMPELVTTKFSNRTINSIVDESILQEETYLKCQMKNPFTREKVKLYGPLVTHLCGTLDNIRVPIRPTIYDKEYTFEQVEYKDYVGSYHVTITLPHTKDINKEEFVLLHRNCANQLQWIEPLLVAAFFSPDPESVADGSDKLKGTQGSFRVMAVGWGNLAGSNIREFDKSGIGRGANQTIKWRNGLKFKGSQRLDECVRTAKPQYKKAVSIHTSDFRTFNIEPDEDKCERLYTPYDCPKIDGGIMEPPFGMELRIFDHFPSAYLLDLMKIITLVANNSDRHQPRRYVYSNKPWIKCVQGIMTDGWNYRIQQDYLNEIRKELGVKLDLSTDTWANNTIALNVFKCLMDELHELNKDGVIVKLMDETPDVKPRIPEINRLCWELSFNQKAYTKVMKQLLNAKKSGIHNGKKTITLNKFKAMLFSNTDLSPRLLKRKDWIHQLNDLCYALEAKNKIMLILSNGYIKKIKLLF